VRILYHHRTLADGAEGIHIASMVSALRALGHEVTVESLAQPSSSGAPGLLAAVRQRLPQALFEVATLSANIVEFEAMRRKLRTGSYDLLYKRHALFDVGAVQAASRLGIPIVLEVNALYSSPAMNEFEPLTLRRLAARFERRTFRLATVTVAVSTPLRRQIEEVAGRGVRVVVVPNGVDPERFDPARTSAEAVRARYGLEGHLIVGWVGVLRRWHGVDLLLRALLHVPDAILLMIGGGTDQAVVEREAAGMGLSSRVRITGRIDHGDVPSHLAACDITVAADDRTGFASPMKVIEYMAMARAVVVPRLPNFLDIVRDGATGLTFTPGDAGDLARRINELAASEHLRRTLGSNAREDVLRSFNWQQNARDILAAARLPAEPAFSR
jgi:glycosyltransferase involved in cell wall biosynthesis